MTKDFSYDPVTAVDEATATGATAEIFADIRETMGIPILTSIWRGLADMDDSLSTVWSAAKPIYLSGHPVKALATSSNNPLCRRPSHCRPHYWLAPASTLRNWKPSGPLLMRITALTA